MPVVDGMTGREIIKAGQKREKDEAMKQQASAEVEMAKLLKLREENTSTKGIFAPIQILELRRQRAGAQKRHAMFEVVVLKLGSDQYLTKIMGPG